MTETYHAPLVSFWLWQGGVSYNMVQRPRNASNCTTKLFSLYKWSCQTLWIDVTNFYMVELIRQLAITTDLWPCLLRAGLMRRPDVCYIYYGVDTCSGGQLWRWKLEPPHRICYKWLQQSPDQMTRWPKTVPIQYICTVPNQVFIIFDQTATCICQWVLTSLSSACV